MTNTTWFHASLAAARFINRHEIPTERGAAWRRTDVMGSRPSHNFYHGGAGVALFHLELYRATGDVQWRDLAVSTGRETLAYLEGLLNAGKPPGVGFSSGWPTYIFVLHQLFKATGESEFHAMARRGYQSLIDQSKALGAGIGWIEPMPYSDITGKTGDRELLDMSIGATGAGMLCLYANGEGLHPDALAHAVQIADRLLELAEKTDDGLLWRMMTDMPFRFTAPNFSHGPAGVGYLMAALYEATQESRYLDAAKSAASYVQSRASASGDGCLVCHTEDLYPDTFYLGLCHGPVGTGRLMFLLHRITGDASYLTWLQRNFAGLVATGAPEARSDGLWENYSQCCGDAGIGDYALYLYRSTSDPQYLQFAERVAEHLASVGRRAATHADELWWPQAEHRGRPDFIETQTGYMQGAAGIGSFFLHLATIDADTPAKIALPDSPFYRQSA